MTHWLIGLGNPGSRYANTRHNAGYWLVDAVAEAAGVRWTNPWFRPFFCARVLRGKDELILLRGKGFMNASADSYTRLWRQGGIDPSRTLVVFDHMDLEPGVLRLKMSGGSGGHNGLKSMDTLWNGQYPRLAVGIGRPEGTSVVEHVLGVPPDDQKRRIQQAITVGVGLFLGEELGGWEGLIREINSAHSAAQSS